MGGAALKHIPLVGITMGDPSGIGPEIIVKALADPALYDFCRPVVLGDGGVLSRYLTRTPRPSIREISDPSQAEGKQGHMDLISVSALDEDRIVPGVPSVKGGQAMVASIVRAVALAKAGRIAAVVTAPISKVLMQEAGHPFEGHTQLIAHLTNCQDYVMMLAGKTLRVALVTIHCALRDVPANLTKDGIRRTIAMTGRALRDDFAIERPRVAVAALNPHAGESGLFGSEETVLIAPAVEEARHEGLIVDGPLPPDTVFYRAAAGHFDAVVAMYHDQGLIPLKLLHFSDAVNVTLGLPIIRTSVDHGTAYDIAGQDVADPSSLKAAIRMAVLMIENRARRAVSSREH
jgi:4-hydroxythreonine-4-phosphate dehydrogenase